MITNKVEENTLTWSEVKNNINTWNNNRSNPFLLKSLFEGNLHFKFHPSTNIAQPKTHLHFYPAVTATGLVLYIIRKDDDRRSVFESDPANFTNLIITARLEQPNGEPDPDTPSIIVDIKSKISAGVAIERIGNWITYHRRWIDEKAKPENNGIFQAFSLEASDDGLHDKLLGYFGLRGTANPFNFSADLILLNTDNDFFNTVRPVPPFHPETEADFFLLEAATGT